MISFPQNFGERQCDRVFLRKLGVAAPGVPAASLLWMLYLVWRDFGTARDDRREVPLDAAARADSDAVAILEAYIGWPGGPGRFIETGIAAGFFSLVAISEAQAELILADFFPANSSSSGISNSELGGVMKSLGKARLQSEAETSDQLRLFESQGGVDIPDATPQQVKGGVFLIHSICNTLKRAKPASEAWKSTLLAKAVAVVKEHPDGDRDLVLKWFVKNRGSQLIPTRLDFVLDQFGSFLVQARKTFAGAQPR